MSISLLEQETIILFNRAEKEAEIFTYEPTLKRKLSEMAEELEEIKQTQDNGAGGLTFTFPKHLIAIRKPRAKRELTEEEKKALAARLHKPD